MYEDKKFLDPIYKIEDLHSLFSFSINIDEYPHYQKSIKNTDLLIDLKTNSKFQRIEVSLSSIKGQAELGNENLTYILFSNLFRLNIKFSDNVFGQVIQKDKFIEYSKYELPIQIDRALINYHQAIHEYQDIVLYSPDSEGVWRLIHTVPMRVPPKLEIIFEKPIYYAKNLENKFPVSLTEFHVFDQYNNKIKKPVNIIGISLDSEL